ncbi:RNA-binding S4 domain-containing protein [Rhodobacteraceae bacterium NNCM2]|nr:RNA-binding S4 domain-containing protein [Coraliihabitans acroporae]
MPETGDTTRLDKWLWQARFFKTRTKATAAVAEGAVRLNSLRCSKPAQPVKPGDVLTFALGHHIRVIRIEGIGQRRGPATEAVGLYTDLEPPVPKAARDEADPQAKDAQRDPGAGRPTKRERREIDALRRS